MYAGVSNPNSVSATVKKVDATIFERDADDNSIGTGHAKNVKIGQNTNTTIALPVVITLLQSGEVLQNANVLQHVASSCGWNLGLSGLGGLLGRRSLHSNDTSLSPLGLTKRANKIPLKVDLRIKISVLSLAFTVPVHGVNVNVDCPSLGGVLGGGGSGGGSGQAFDAGAASSLIANNPIASSAAQAGNTAALSSVAAQAAAGGGGGSGSGDAGNPLSGILSFVSEGSMPIRRTAPTAAAAPRFTAAVVARATPAF